MLIPPGIVIRKIALEEQNSSATGLSAFIGILALLIGIYHHAYDCLLFTVPWLAMILFGKQTLSHVPRSQRITIGLLLFVPAINYAATLAFRNLMKLDQYSFTWQSITMVNGVCITLSLLILMFEHSTAKAKQRKQDRPKRYQDKNFDQRSKNILIEMHKFFPLIKPNK